MMTSRVVEFTKMHGTGNDFLVLDNRSYQFSRDELSGLAASWCPRRYGVGADGLLALDVPATAGADYRMHYVNADGSWATMCGNGARCLARFARMNGFDDAELAFDTDAGLYHAELSEGEEGPVRLFVPEVSAFRHRVDLEQPLPDAIDALCYVHAGTEHLVAFVEDPEAVPVEEWGASFRQDPHLAPEGANVNFVRAHGRNLRLRTYEKGVEGETPSCGTGILAAAAAAERTGRATDPPLTVRATGGELRVGRAQTRRGPERYLEGPAVPVFRGQIEPPENK